LLHEGDLLGLPAVVADADARLEDEEREEGGEPAGVLLPGEVELPPEGGGLEEGVSLTGTEPVSFSEIRVFPLPELLEGVLGAAGAGDDAAPAKMSFCAPSWNPSFILYVGLLWLPSKS